MKLTRQSKHLLIAFALGASIIATAVADPEETNSTPSVTAKVPKDIPPIALSNGSNLEISFYIVEHVDTEGNSHRLSIGQEDRGDNATLQDFTMLISTILPEREIGQISGMFRIGDELWSFSDRSVALLNSGRLIVNTRLSVKDGEKGTTELVSKEPYMTVKVIGNREQNVTEFIDVGVKIEAQPKILENGRINSAMKMSISEVLRENDNSRATRVPVVSYRTVNTTIDFVPGKLELLSELTIRKTVQMRSGIPYLRNIPILGKFLFSHTAKEDTDTKLYIVGGVAATTEAKIDEYHALKEQIEKERLEGRPNRFR